MTDLIYKDYTLARLTAFGSGVWEWGIIHQGSLAEMKVLKEKVQKQEPSGSYGIFAGGTVIRILNEGIKVD